MMHSKIKQNNFRLPLIRTLINSYLFHIIQGNENKSTGVIRTHLIE